jgi:hypothetical protein
MQNYFEIPEIIFNKKELQQLYTNNKNEWASYGTSKNNSLYTQYVSLDNAVIASIINKFNNLNIVENIKFFKTLTKGNIQSHTDKRKVAINIPVVVDNKSCTVFYEKTNSFDIPKITVGDKVQDVNAKRFKKSKVVEKMYLNKATCLNTNVPHGVINDSTNDRVILSISFRDEYDSFSLIKDMYNNGKLI